MLRTLLSVVTAVATLAAQAPIEFEAASLKPNTSRDLPVTRTPDPATGEFRMVRATLRTLILRGYPVNTAPVQIINLPSWAGDYYDFTAKARPRTTPEEQQQMFRAFLADRLKLLAHYETREQPGYNLVFARADHRLGPGLRPSVLDCDGGDAPRPQPSPGFNFVTYAREHCGFAMTDIDGTLNAGGWSPERLATLIGDTVQRPVVDQTGLTGFYAVTLRFLPRFAAATAAPDPSPDALPSISTAIQEQLGLKLESATVQAQVLVIDRIERPAAD